MSPELSVIIPALNEADALPLLLADLAVQRDLALEVLVVDGGSADATVRIAGDVFSAGPLKGRCLAADRGRGRQLNAGAAAARTDWLLFLHADSRLPDPHQLRRALDDLETQRRRLGSDALAGRFALRFDNPAGEKGAGLYYCEAKAALGRAGCIHGDQGLLLPRSFFARIGPFREDWPVMEDTELAEAVRDTGRWLLLPGIVITSSRRFGVEGFRVRQTLNALLMNARVVGWPEFILQAPGVYRRQDSSRPLALRPFLELADGLLSAMPAERRRAVWRATGAYVRGQAWQLLLALDCRAARRLGRPPELAAGRWLALWDRWGEPLTDHRAGRFVAELLVRVWYRRTLNRARAGGK